MINIVRDFIAQISEENLSIDRKYHILKTMANYFILQGKRILTEQLRFMENISPSQKLALKKYIQNVNNGKKIRENNNIPDIQEIQTMYNDIPALKESLFVFRGMRKFLDQNLTAKGFISTSLDFNVANVFTSDNKYKIINVAKNTVGLTDEIVSDVIYFIEIPAGTKVLPLFDLTISKANFFYGFEIPSSGNYDNEKEVLVNINHDLTVLEYLGRYKKNISIYSAVILPVTNSESLLNNLTEYSRKQYDQKIAAFKDIKKRHLYVVEQIRVYQLLDCFNLAKFKSDIKKFKARELSYEPSGKNIIYYDLNKLQELIFEKINILNIKDIDPSYVIYLIFIEKI